MQAESSGHDADDCPLAQDSEWQLEDETRGNLGSDDSFANVGPDEVVAKLQALQHATDPVPGLKKLCSSYEILELEGAEQDLFRQGIASLVVCLRADNAVTRAAYKEALLLVLRAMQGSEDACLDVLQACLQLHCLHLQEVAGELSRSAAPLVRLAPVPLLFPHTASCCAARTCCFGSMSLFSAPVWSIWISDQNRDPHT